MQTLRPARPLVALLLAAGMLAVSAPAKAALPSSTPTGTHRCANGKTARTWIKFGPHPIGVSRLAADNPCKTEWVLFYFHGASESDPYGLSVFVAPGQRINLEGAALAEWGLNSWWDEEYGDASLVAPKDACVRNYDHPTGGWTGYRGLLFKSATDVRDAPECGQPIPKYSANHYVALPCPSPDGHEIFLTYKTEGKKIVKVAVWNRYCTDWDRWAVAWWKLDNGRTVGVWVGPGEEIDLWKSDFGKLPVKSRDGRVRLTTAPAGAEDDAFRSDAKKRPFYYNGFVHDDTVSCSAGKKSC
jgi:hypothetical protein